MVSIDLYSAASYAGGQPHEQFAWLRRNDPVHRHPLPDGSFYWAVTRHADVVAVGRDHERFSSRPTVMIEGGQSSAPGDDHVMMLMADPPLHTRMRRLVSGHFTPRAARALRPRIAELATRIVDEVVEAGRCDLVADLAGEMPSFVIADVLGIPLEDGRALYHHTEALHAAVEAVGVEAKQAAFREMMAYAGRTFAAKQADPADDLASLLATGELDGRPIDEMDFFLWFLLLVDAGGDTTRNLVGAGLWALFHEPAALDHLRSRVATGAPLGPAVEELLRWVSPVIYMRRTATADTELAGRAIAAGDRVVVYYGAANRDPAAFDEPDRLDLTRATNPHVAFGGGGPHFCLGAHLARIEIEALLAEVVGRLDGLAPAGDPTWMPSNFVFGPASLPVTFNPGTRTPGARRG